MLNGLYRLANAKPWEAFTISSGDRTKQPAVATFGVKAPEGKSNHEIYAYGRGPYDEAIDVEANGLALGLQISNLELLPYGIHVPLASDPLHVTLLGVNG